MEKNYDIIAGKSIGGIELGITFEEFSRQFTEEYTEQKLTDERILESENMMFWFDENDRLFQILVYGNYPGKFMGKIGLGSTMAEVEAIAGEYESEYEIIVTYTLKQIPGIGFEVADCEAEDCDECKYRRECEEDREWYEKIYEKTILPIETISVFDDNYFRRLAEEDAARVSGAADGGADEK